MKARIFTQLFLLINTNIIETIKKEYCIKHLNAKNVPNLKQKINDLKV